MITIYHNPKCSKSRDGVEFLKNHADNFEIIDYIKNGISIDELKRIIILLNIDPKELIRINETIWKENYKNKSLSNDEIIQAMIENPKLIQRPIIINGKKAIIGRPTENIKQIL